MRIRTAFALAGLLGALLVGIGIWLSAETYERVSRIAEVRQVASTIASSGFRLALLTGDVLLYREVRSERQWRETQTQLRQFITRHRVALEEYRHQVDAIVRQLDDLDDLFQRLHLRIDAVQAAGGVLRDDEVFSLLASQMSIRVTELQSAIDEFDLAFERSLSRTLGASGSNLVVELSLLLTCYAAFGAGIWLFFYRRLLLPLSDLRRTIKRIMEGEATLRPQAVAADEVGSVVAAFNDLLDRQQAADQALAANAGLLKQANRELENFVYVASHDLRAPLRGLDNLATWIDEDLRDFDNAEVKENLALMKSRVRRMDLLLEGLLQYSRVGRREYPAEDVDTGVMLAEIVEMMTLPAGFAVSFPQAMPVLRAQKPPLEMVFRNLIGNAVKHHDRPVGRITVAWRDQGDVLEFTVADDGPGIAAEFHEKVFGMFQTLKPRDEVEGSGMGLALVKRAVEHHGGQIRLRSPVDQDRGSEFVFTWRKIRGGP